MAHAHAVPYAVADLSHSRLDAYEKCPASFWHAYVNGTPPDGYERVEQWTGSLVHKVLEETIRRTVERRVPDPLWVLQRYEELWRAALGPHVLVVREGRRIEDYFANGRRWLSDYLDHAWPFLDATPLLVEEKVSFPLALADGRPVTFHGILDRADRLRDGRIRLIDYKTGAWMPTFEDDRDAYQLALYWRGLAPRFPEAPGAVLVWQYLQQRTAKRIEAKPALLERAERWVTRRAEEIEGRLGSGLAPPEAFPPRPGPLCRWCEFGYACDANPYRDGAPRPRPAATAPADPPT